MNLGEPTPHRHQLTGKAQCSTLAFEGTYQLGQVIFNFYLSNKILTCPAKRCDRMNMKVTILYILYFYLKLFSCYSFICTVELVLDFPCVIVSLKLHDEILPAI